MRRFEKLRRTTVRLALIPIVTSLLVSCGGDADTAGQSPSPSPSTVELIGSFDIGGGREMYLICRGSGSPTILLEAGGADDSGTWWPEITGPLQARTRTCAYDRAGTRQSYTPAEDQPRTMADVVADLDALLAKAGITDKLLLVGSSFGGWVALDFALHHSDRVAGMVILDTDWPTVDLSRSPIQVMSAAERKAMEVADAWDSPDNYERIAYEESARETEAAFHTLPGIPIRILTAGLWPDCPDSPPECAKKIKIFTELQAQWLRLSPTATQRVVQSGHVMHHEVPDLVRDEILAVLDKAD